MNARAAAAWCLAALTVALSSANPVYRALVVLCALNVLVAHRRSDTRLRPLLLAVIVAGSIALLITTVLSHSGAHAFAQVPPAIPVLGGAYTYEALVFGVSTALGIAAAILPAAALSLVVDPAELVDALPALLSRSGAALGTALNLIPGLARSAVDIRDAQRMRGWRPRRARDWPDLAVPVVLTAIESSSSLAEAMEARGYGAGTRTHYAVTKWHAADVVVCVASLAAAAAFVALRVSGAVADWYPFPAITTPSVDIGAAACCLALASPLLIKRRS